MKIFIVEDDAMQAEMVKDHLQHNPRYQVTIFTTGEKMLERIGERPDVILLDHNLNSVEKKAMDGIDVLKKIKEKDEAIEVVMYSGQDSIEVAVDTMKYGAFDYIVKNASAFHRLDNILIKIIKLRKMGAENSRLKRNNTILLILVPVIIVVAVLVYYFLNVQKMGWSF